METIEYVTYQDATRDAHARMRAASAQYNAARTRREREVAMQAIRQAERACEAAYNAWEAQ